jgi:hypothetical protein
VGGTLPEGRSMSHGMIYAGQEAFESALVEVDDTKMHERILESTTAIEHRLLNSIDLHNTEFKEMITATSPWWYLDPYASPLALWPRNGRPMSLIAPVST